MKFIFQTDFTQDIKLYIIRDKMSSNEFPFLIFTNSNTIDDLIGRIGLNRPDEIIFYGKASIFKGIENYYKDKEIKITWL